MTEIEQYRIDLLEEVKVSAAQGNFSHESFVSLVAERLVAAEELNDWTQCYYYPEKSYRGRKVALDGFLLEDIDIDSTATLIVADFRGGEKLERITTSQLSAACDKVLYFAEDAIAGRLKDLEPSKRQYDLADWLFNYRSRLASLRIFVLTDAILDIGAKELPSKTLDKLRVDIHVWDIGRLFRSQASGGREPIEIDLTEFVPDGIPVLRASQEDADYDAYLCTVSGTVLADLYDKYGSRLLEGNVRSFLSVKGGVNKGIRSTILGEPHRFFAYNNGVAATATEAQLSRIGGIDRITRLKDFQIVNGGQTTASLFMARRKDKEKADLSRIFVPIKLSVVTPEQAGELIPLISRYANSQNKVSDADFFSNHPFHQRIEDISRKVWAPPAAGVSHQTKWFYERARGQYINEQVRLSDGQKKIFQLQHPKGQVITKTDLAKFHNSWACLPDVVSLGAQKNFVRFAEAITPAWEASDVKFNERWFKIAIGKAILYESTERIVSKQPWYQAGQPRAQIVTYTIALMSHLVSLRRKVFDFEQLWKQQLVPASLVPIIEELSFAAFEVVVSPPAHFSNVTEWCKKEACWNQLRTKGGRLQKGIDSFLLSTGEEAAENRDAKREQALDNKLARLTYIMEKREEYWTRALEWDRERNILPDKERSIVSLIAKKRGFVPSDAQALVAIEAEKLLLDEGFK